MRFTGWKDVGSYGCCMSQTPNSQHESEEAFFDVWFDGGFSRAIPLMEGMVVIEGKEFYRRWPGPGGSNQAEAKAAILGCELVSKLPIPSGATIRFTGDSQLIIDFMNEVAEPDKLKEIVSELHSACATLPPIIWRSVPRELNLAGKALERLQTARSR